MFLYILSFFTFQHYPGSSKFPIYSQDGERGTPAPGRFRRAPGVARGGEL